MVEEQRNDSSDAEFADDEVSDEAGQVEVTPRAPARKRKKTRTKKGTLIEAFMFLGMCADEDQAKARAEKTPAADREIVLQRAREKERSLGDP